MTVDVDARRDELRALRARLLTAAEDLVHDDDDDGELNSAGGDQHLADHATDMVDREIDDSLEENADRVIHEIDEALRQLDDGSYGTCTACGEKIPEERLAAVPYATLCVRDKRAREHG
jgi:RNA polymerase-binding transcription factor